jgi:hypothetical protein
MHGETQDKRRLAKIAREVEALRDAQDRRRVTDVIYHCRVIEALCMQDVLYEPPAPPQGVLLTIDEVSKKTGYSKSRLRHIGHKLAGYWKSPTGKVGWYSGPLEAALAVNGVTPE